MNAKKDKVIADLNDKFHKIQNELADVRRDVIAANVTAESVRSDKKKLEQKNVEKD